jgi:hypothetical protein
MTSQEGSDERGFILILTMLVLVVLTTLCIAGLDTSTFEVQIAANDRSSRVAFNLADGGALAVGKLVDNVISADPESKVPIDIPSSSFTGFTDPDGNTATNVWVDSKNNDFIDRLKGFVEPRDEGYDFHIPSTFSTLGDVYARIQKPEITYGVGGGSTEFASGAAGAGVGAATYRDVELEVDAFADARNARSGIAVSFLFKNN